VPSLPCEMVRIGPVRPTEAGAKCQLRSSDHDSSRPKLNFFVRLMRRQEGAVSRAVHVVPFLFKACLSLALFLTHNATITS